MKVIKPLENRYTLLKGATTKITSQEGRFLNFLRPVMTAGLPLIRNVLIPLANALMPLQVSAAMWPTHAAFQRKIMDQQLLH